MSQCHVCGATEGRTELVNEVFLIDDKFILVENIPATVCGHCGEPTFSRERRKDSAHASWRGSAG